MTHPDFELVPNTGTNIWGRILFFTAICTMSLGVPRAISIWDPQLRNDKFMVPFLALRW